ncbi:hypothetical protein SS50377_22155 [Spironucleus salmonicida]|uniref:Transmembrane protein n=1 Tax=Spironucleus salmonicida TaxID=348837 RepID=V6LPQ6_9EUKA|nr:hypothetical protein SS50377_22155 [Spironucleus salmonicida]|eukprot:EST45686.1 Hypothetical protein SS50377_14259 [Spironucleus salmonicida]
MFQILAELVFSGPDNFQQFVPANTFIVQDTYDYFIFRDGEYEINMITEMNKQSIIQFSSLFRTQLLPTFSSHNYQIFKDINFSVFVTSRNLFTQAEKNLKRQAVAHYKSNQSIMLSVAYLEENINYFAVFGCNHIPCIVIPAKKYSENVVNFAEFLEKSQIQWVKQIETTKDISTQDTKLEDQKQQENLSFIDLDIFKKKNKHSKGNMLFKFYLSIVESCNIKYVATIIAIFASLNLFLLHKLSIVNK